MYTDRDGRIWPAKSVGATLPDEEGNVITSLYVPGNYDFDTITCYLNLACWDYQLDLTIPITD